VYLKGSPLEAVARQAVTLSSEAGEFVGLIGPTGSAKSTLIKHLNALLRPTGGEVRVAGINPADARADVKTLRQQVGLVFQYPEHQLFEETVYDDVAYCPRNLGLTEDQVRERVGESQALVGVDPRRFGRRSPFSLSGGPVREIFRRAQDLTALGLGVPAITALMLRLRSAGMAVTPDVLTVDEARAAIGKVLQWN